MKRFVTGLAAALMMLGAMSSSPASAQPTPQGVSQQQQDWCYGTATPDQRIVGCTAVIQSGDRANLPSAYVNRCQSYGGTGLYDKAIEDCTQAIALKPDYAIAYVQRASATSDRGQRDNSIADQDHAIADTMRALSLEPTPAAYYIRGLAYFRKGLRNQAIADFRTALQLDPNFKPASTTLAEIGESPSVNTAAPLSTTATSTSSSRAEGSLYPDYVPYPSPMPIHKNQYNGSLFVIGADGKEHGAPNREHDMRNCITRSRGFAQGGDRDIFLNNCGVDVNVHAFEGNPTNFQTFYGSPISAGSKYPNYYETNLYKYLFCSNQYESDGKTAWCT